MSAGPVKLLVRHAMRLTGFARWGVRPITQRRFAGLLASAAPADTADADALADCRALAGRTEARELATRTALAAATSRLERLEALAAHAAAVGAAVPMRPHPALLGPPGGFALAEEGGTEDGGAAIDPRVTARFGLPPRFLRRVADGDAAAPIDVLCIDARDGPPADLRRCLACQAELALPGGLAALDAALTSDGLGFVGFVRLDRDEAGRTVGAACLYARDATGLAPAEAVRLGLVLHGGYGLQGLALELLGQADRQDGGDRRHRHAAGLAA